MNNEAIPKSVARVLNAAKVQEEWKKRKGDGEDGGKAKKRRKTTEQGNKGKSAASTIKILPGESLAHFSRYVRSEDQFAQMS